jgi:hypothetical protein
MDRNDAHGKRAQSLGVLSFAFDIFLKKGPAGPFFFFTQSVTGV